MDEPRRVLQSGVLPNGNSITTFDDPNAAEIFSDGVFSMQVTPAVTRIFMFKNAVKTGEFEPSAAGPSTIEERQKSCVLILPTTSFLEWILSTIDNLPSLVTAMDEMRVQMAALSQRVNAAQHRQVKK